MKQKAKYIMYLIPLVTFSTSSAAVHPTLEPFLSHPTHIPTPRSATQSPSSSPSSPVPGVPLVPVIIEVGVDRYSMYRDPNTLNPVEENISENVGQPVTGIVVHTPRQAYPAPIETSPLIHRILNRKKWDDRILKMLYCCFPLIVTGFIIYAVEIQ